MGSWLRIGLVMWVATLGAPVLAASPGSNPSASAPDSGTAQPDDDTPDSPADPDNPADPDDQSVEPTPATTVAVVPVPSGCAVPHPPHVVFVGEVVGRTDRSARFRIDSVRAGRPEPYNDGEFIDIRYGLDVQYLDDGERYLVGAPVHPDLGILVSRVTDPVEHFGGDEVIGVTELDIACPDLEDPMRTLHLDGTPIEASVLGPFTAAKVRVAAAVLIPLGVAFAAVFALATLRLSLSGVYRTIIRPRS